MTMVLSKMRPASMPELKGVRLKLKLESFGIDDDGTRCARLSDATLPPSVPIVDLMLSAEHADAMGITFESVGDEFHIDVKPVRPATYPIKAA